MKPVKPKKCSICKREFIPRSSTAKVCSMDCAIEHSKIIASKQQAKNAQIERATHRESISNARPLSWYIRRAQTVLNRYILIRDANDGCISCGTRTASQYHAGHYIPTTRAIHRFNPSNIHKQCLKCNNYLHGNLTAYKPNLVAKVGKGIVENLEASQHILKRWTREELTAIWNEYKAKKSPSD